MTTRNELINQIEAIDRRAYACQQRGETVNAQLAWFEMNDLEQQLEDCAIGDAVERQHALDTGAIGDDLTDDER